MATTAVARVDNQGLHHTDKIVRRLDDFPELLQALRDGDLPTVRFLWEQLFDCDSRRNPAPTLQAATKLTEEIPSSAKP